jgi:hypothetical protein
MYRIRYSYTFSRISKASLYSCLQDVIFLSCSLSLSVYLFLILSFSLIVYLSVSPHCFNNIVMLYIFSPFSFCVLSHNYPDINECSEGIDQCAQNCHNTDGSYTCSCNTGYSLDSNGRGCSDIDECALNTDGCAQNCQNTVGSYTCSCNPGYRLNADQHGCDGESLYTSIISKQY